jgi:hypothetical protein
LRRFTSHSVSQSAAYISPSLDIDFSVQSTHNKLSL